MFRSASSNLMSVGRATAFMVGLLAALILCLIWIGPAKADHDCQLSTDASRSVSEGGSITLSVTAANCAEIDWDLDNDGAYDDGSGTSVTFMTGERDGPGSQIVKIEGSKTVQVCEWDPEIRRNICWFEEDIASAQTTVNIFNIAPTATLNAPTPVNEGSSINLSFTGATDPSLADRNAGFTYAFNCGSGYGVFTPSPGTSCSTNDSGSRTVRGAVRDEDGGVREYLKTVTVNNVAPTATFNAPSSVDEGSAINLSLSSPFDPSSVDMQSLQYRFDCGSGYGDFGNSNTASCPASAPGNHTVKGQVRDKDGGESPEYTASVTINDITAPTVKKVVPAEGAKDIAPGTNVSAFFSEAMRKASINTKTIKLYQKGSTTLIAAQVSYDAAKKKAILNPDANLKRGMSYKAVVTAGARDLAGNRLDQNPSQSGNQPKVWFFKVRT